MWKTCALLIIVAATAFATSEKFVCFYGSWANYVPGKYRFSIENIDSTLCTHMVYSYVGITQDSKISILDSWGDADLGGLKRFTSLSTHNQKIKLLLELGDWNACSSAFWTLISSPSHRATFIQSVITFLQAYGFDGIVLNWQYLPQHSPPKTAKANIPILLAEMRTAFDRYGYLLAAVLPCPTVLFDQIFDVPALCKYLDFIIIIAFDFTDAWDPVTGHNAPLYPSSRDVTQTARSLNVDACIKELIYKEADKKKLILGVAIYGRKFTIANCNNKGIGAPAIVGATIGYNEICEKIKGGGWTVAWDAEQQVPYAYNGNQWISYDNVKSIALKVEYAKSKDLGGIMVSSVEKDDFNGACGEVNILLKTVRRTLDSPVINLLPPLPASITINLTDSNNQGHMKWRNSLRSTSTCSNPPILIRSAKLVCYHGSWANYRQGNCRYTIENIDPTLCTHVIYGFVGITEDSKIRIMDSWLDVDLGALKRLTGLRAQNPNLKSLVAVGGWNEGSTKFSTMVSSASRRATFIQSAITFLQTYGFDGLDLDWEYPSQRGGAPTDKANFSILLAELRAAFDKYGFLLTAAVPAAAVSVDQSYEVPALNRYLDFINVMTYDFHGAWDPVTGHNAPLFPSSTDVTEAARGLNVDAAIKAWIARGADPAKLILGVGIYGRTFTLTNTNNKGIGAPTSGGAPAGRCTLEASILGYNEICEKIKGGGWTVVWDAEQQVPYAHNGNQWIGYDNPESVALKVEYAKSKGLGGIMVWSLETDDFNGICGEVNIILKTIRRTLQLPVVTVTPPPTAVPIIPCVPEEPGQPSASPSPPAATTTPSPPAVDNGGVCGSRTGYIRDPNNCGVFYQCVQQGSVIYDYQFNCPAGLYFDPSIIACNYPSQVSCTNSV